MLYLNTYEQKSKVSRVYWNKISDYLIVCDNDGNNCVYSKEYDDFYEGKRKFI